MALAKRTNRKASKTPVITNETVAASKGRLSIASENSAPLPKFEPSATPAPAAKKPAATAASTSATPPSPPSTARNLEAQVTNRNMGAQSTAGVIKPTVGARNLDAQSTGRSYQGESTARTIPAQDSTRPPQ